jgi:choline transport protein
MAEGLSKNVADLDHLELEAAGYQEAMPRQFSLWSLGALSFTLTCTWLGAGSSIGISLTQASSAGSLWSLLVAGFMTLIVASGMAELASAYPCAGAQVSYISQSLSPDVLTNHKYYWAFMVSGERHKAFASYL